MENKECQPKIRNRIEIIMTPYEQKQCTKECFEAVKKDLEGTDYTEEELRGAVVLRMLELMTGKIQEKTNE